MCSKPTIMAKYRAQSRQSLKQWALLTLHRRWIVHTLSVDVVETLSDPGPRPVAVCPHWYQSRSASWICLGPEKRSGHRGADMGLLRLFAARLISPRVNSTPP